MLLVGPGSGACHHNSRRYSERYFLRVSCRPLRGEVEKLAGPAL